MSEPKSEEVIHILAEILKQPDDPKHVVFWATTAIQTLTPTQDDTNLSK